MHGFHTAALLVAGCCLAPVGAQTTGFVPLVDLGTGTYHGFQGGLYPGGTNAPPPQHLADALARAAEIVPRDAAGIPSAEGWIAMIAIGMSNTTHEFAVFERNEDRNPGRNARVVLIDTGLGGQDASTVADPLAAYWTVLAQRLAAVGLTPAQVQVAWLKEAEAQPPNDFPLHAQGLRDNLARIANNLHDKFPNLKLVYVSSRIYGGYATGPLNPEPQAYESGFSVKWLIEDQIAGAPDLNYGHVPGPVRAPLLLWGPYLWADGTKPRSDGLVWLREDLEADGTHPSPSGEAKVAGLLSAFFATESTAEPWWPARGDSLLVPVDALRDAHVVASAPDSNFGTEPQLLARGGDQLANAYLAFDVSSSPRPAARAKLSARVVQAGGGQVRLVSDPSWGEETITWNNAPAIGPGLVAMPQSSRDGTIDADVTASINADLDGLTSFALVVPASSATSYWSKEGGQPPRIVLTIACPVDTDADGRGDACDCAPADPGAFALPGDIENLLWDGPMHMIWESIGPSAGNETRYDVLAGTLAELRLPAPRPGDTCLADDLADTEIDDGSPAPPPGQGRFFLVRGDNACGEGPWTRPLNGAPFQAVACP